MYVQILQRVKQGKAEGLFINEQQCNKRLQQRTYVEKSVS